jgi:anion-transporting  ArsA/GET3 family ATPase
MVIGHGGHETTVRRSDRRSIRKDSPKLADDYGVLTRPLVFVTGKGGTGKSTVAEALARAVAPGARVCRTADFDAERAMGEWLSRHLGSAAAALLRRSQAFGYLVAAAPGAAELVTIGKVVDQARRGRVIVDGPSTGHALAMLAAPRTFSRVTSAGPLGRETNALRERLKDPAFTTYVGVTLPEPMAVAELLELERDLPGTVGRGLDLIVVNAVHPDRFSDQEARCLSEVSARWPALEDVLVEHRRARREAAQVNELRRRSPAPVIALGFVYPPADCVELLAAELRSAVAASRP